MKEARIEQVGPPGWAGEPAELLAAILDETIGCGFEREHAVRYHA